MANKDGGVVCKAAKAAGGAGSVATGTAMVLLVSGILLLATDHADGSGIMGVAALLFSAVLFGAGTVSTKASELMSKGGEGDSAAQVERNRNHSKPEDTGAPVMPEISEKGSSSSDRF